MSETSVITDEKPNRQPMVEVRNVSKYFSLDDSILSKMIGEQEFVHAVDDISFTIYRGETLTLVGESGSGKSTVANLVAGLYTPTSGEIRIDNESVGSVTTRSSETLTDIGMVFQDPTSSLDPRMTIQQIIAEPMRSQGWSNTHRQQRVKELFDLVDLSPMYADRYPHELSGGQTQRVAIARAVALDPKLLVLDEPVSALDASVQAKILNLLMELQTKLELTYLFIAHDLNVIEHIADRVAVMYLGKLMEISPVDQLFEQPANPYTYTLLSAIPKVTPGTNTDRVILEGDVPSPVDPPSGCVFHTRCPVAQPECAERVPDVEHVEKSASRCLFAQDCADGELFDD
jgi:oligopeptide/dipeptide ABC transporter ATP-binding protein